MSNHRYCYPTVTPVSRPAASGKPASEPKPASSATADDRSSRAA